MAAAARAAVNGDEGALDMFDWQKSGQKFNMSQAESIQMYFGTKDGKTFILSSSLHNVLKDLKYLTRLIRLSQSSLFF